MSNEFDKIMLNTVLHDTATQNIDLMTQLDVPGSIIDIMRTYHSHCEQSARTQDDFLRAISSINEEARGVISVSRRRALGSTLLALAQPNSPISDQTRLGFTLILLLAIEHGNGPQDIFEEMGKPSDTTLLTAPLGEQAGLLDEAVLDHQFTADVLAELGRHEGLSEQSQARLEHCQLHLRALRSAGDVSQALQLVLNNGELLEHRHIAVHSADILLDLHDQMIDLDEALDRIEEMFSAVAF